LKASKEGYLKPIAIWMESKNHGEFNHLLILGRNHKTKLQGKKYD
jgi:hypothetical protein